MIQLEARKQFPTLVVASLGAVRKDKPDGQFTARVLFDDTQGLEVNKRTRIRDQERAPISADLKRSMSAKAAKGNATFAVTADISEAHSQVPKHPEDWKLLGCQVRRGGEVFVNTVGTFGVSSASYCWSWIAGALGRLALYLAGSSASSWHMLVSRRLSIGDQWPRIPLCNLFLLYSGGRSVNTTVLAESAGGQHAGLNCYWMPIVSASLSAARSGPYAGQLRYPQPLLCI